MRPTSNRQHGFTLLELMLSLLLMGTMMAAAWTMMGTFRDRFEISQQRMERSQLIRSLQQTLEQDLRSCAAVVRKDETEATRPQVAVTEIDGPPSRDDNVGYEMPGEQFDTNGKLNADESTVPADWLSPDSFLLGTSHMLMFDRTTAATPDARKILTVETTLQLADLPDVSRRVVYAFVDPLTAARAGRPTGLIRCQLLSRQLAVWRNLSGDNLDFLEVVRPTLAEIGPNPNIAPEPPPDDVPLSEKSPMISGFTAHPQVSLQHSDQLDYVPELRSLSFRYFDGETWRTSWDTRLEHALPVAIELRFALVTQELDSSPKAEVTDDDFGNSLPPSLVIEELPEIPIEPVDDRMRSAQTRPPQDHRYLIHLRSASLSPPTEHELGSATNPPSIRENGTP